MLFFKAELQRSPEKTGAEFSKRFKTMLDTIRVGQRRLFRFARYDCQEQMSHFKANEEQRIESAIRKFN
jgi:hypothetical protein